KVETEGNQIVHFLEQMPGVYVTRSLTGRPGKTYKLHVNVDNKEYSAVSVMPYPVPMDTLRLTLTTFMNNQNKSIEVTYKDSLGVANYYRFQLFVNDIPSKKIFVSSDELSDGKIVSQDLYDFDINLKKDDVVEV